MVSAASVDADPLRPATGAIPRFMASHRRSSAVALSWRAVRSSRDDMLSLLSIRRDQDASQPRDRAGLRGIDRRSAPAKRLGDLISIEPRQPQFDDVTLVGCQMIEQCHDFQSVLPLE